MRLFPVIQLLLFCASLSLPAQQTTRQQLYHSFIACRIDQWGTIISEFEKNTSLDTEAEKLEMANYCYGYIGYLLGEKRLKDAEVYLKKGQELVDQIIEANPHSAAAYSYKGAFLGFRISTDHSVALILGPSSAFYIKKAYQMNEQNIQCMIDRGNLYFYSPGFFGGDVTKAIRLYLQAVEKMEKTGESRENWEYFNLLVLLAKAYDQAKKYSEAEQVYLKILSIEPEFSWVKKELLPDLKKGAK